MSPTKTKTKTQKPKTRKLDAEVQTIIKGLEVTKGTIAMTKEDLKKSWRQISRWSKESRKSGATQLVAAAIDLRRVGEPAIDAVAQLLVLAAHALGESSRIEKMISGSSDFEPKR